MKQLVSDYISLSKPRIVLLFVITGLTAIIMEGSLLSQPVKLWAVLLGITLCGASANVLNQYVDRDIDGLMERTAKKRPIPLGKIKPKAALKFGIVLGILSLGLFLVYGNLLAAALSLGTIFYYVVIYTMWLKRRTPYNIVIGGAAGATAPLIGWAAATNNVSLVGFWLFLIIFMWTPAHFWALALVVKDEYKKASVPMLPVVRGDQRTRWEILAYTLLMVPVTLFPALVHSAGPVYAAIAGLLDAGFLYFVIKLMKLKDNKSAYKVFGYSIVYLLTLFIVMGVTTLTWAAESIPPELKDVGIEEKLGAPIDMNLQFRDETGADVQLNKYFNGKKPVALLLVYYGCPSLCSFFLNGVTDTLKRTPWTPGQEFEVVTVSIDSREKPELANGKKESIFKIYGRESARKGWHFLTGNDENIKKLTESVGFRYKYDKESDQFAHVSAITVLSPDAHVMRYLYGIEFRPMDLKLALNEAGQGKVGNLVDRFLLFCFHYDPKNRKYSLYALNAMKAAGGTTVLALGTLLIVGIRRRPIRWKENTSS